MVLGEGGQGLGDLVVGAHDDGGVALEVAFDLGAVGGIESGRITEAHGAAGAQAEAGVGGHEGLLAGLLAGGGGADAQGGEGLAPVDGAAAGPLGEVGAVVVHDLDLLAAGEELGVGVVEVVDAGPGGRLARGAQEPDLRHLGREGADLDRGVGVGGGKLVAQEGDRLLDEGVDGVGVDDAALVEGCGRAHVPAGGAAQAHVDATGVEGGQGGEALGHLERAVVHGHDAARAHPDAVGGVQDVHHEQVGRRGQEGAGAVVLGQPEAVVAGLLQAAPQADEVPQGSTNVSPLEERNLLEDADPAETRTHGFS